MPQEEQHEILTKFHSSPYGGHFESKKIAEKVLQSRFFWPNLYKDSHKYVQSYDGFQRVGTISRRNEIPLNNIQEVEIFDVWAIELHGTVSSFVWKIVHPSCRRLCIKVGKGDRYREK